MLLQENFLLPALVLHGSPVVSHLGALGSRLNIKYYAKSIRVLPKASAAGSFAALSFSLLISRSITSQ
jgi:hypothetical protein